MAPAPETANSFTALLELPPTQVVELLHSSEHTGKLPLHVSNPKPYPLTSVICGGTSNLTFPSNAALVERAARFSVFAGENPPQTEVKDEQQETDSNPSLTQGGGDCVSDPTVENKNSKGAKRKQLEKKVHHQRTQLQLFLRIIRVLCFSVIWGNSLVMLNAG